ncbi:MAG TPA: hypothetical protein PLV96_05610 [Methanoregulaceae archaeon]|nr:hypothetical protein [Methanoregulaceae archaeon]HQA80253.1 hypothetical protein [Methanoregulaceae archaeon]
MTSGPFLFLLSSRTNITGWYPVPPELREQILSMMSGPFLFLLSGRATITG